MTMEKSRVITALHVTGAFLLAGVFVYVGAILAGRHDTLPLIQEWMLVRGMIFVVFPAYFLLSYFLLSLLLRPFQDQQASSGSGDRRRTSVLAILSLLLAGPGLLIPLLGSLFSIILGHAARYRCRKHPEIAGAGIALTGLTLGYIELAFFLYIVCMSALLSASR